jgi:hypothetical protein
VLDRFPKTYGSDCGRILQVTLLTCAASAGCRRQTFSRKGTLDGGPPWWHARTIKSLVEVNVHLLAGYVVSVSVRSTTSLSTSCRGLDVHTRAETEANCLPQKQTSFMSYVCRQHGVCSYVCGPEKTGGPCSRKDHATGWGATQAMLRNSAGW